MVFLLKLIGVIDILGIGLFFIVLYSLDLLKIFVVLFWKFFVIIFILVKILEVFLKMLIIMLMYIMSKDIINERGDIYNKFIVRCIFIKYVFFFGLLFGLGY